MAVQQHFRTPLVGRDRELHELRSALAAAREGRGQLLLLSGEPGIGKTRLAEEAELIARADSARVLWGRCHEIEGRPPYWPWVQILRAYALDVGPAQVAAEIETDTLPLAQLVPELRPHLSATPPVSTPDSDSARFRLFLGLAALLRRVARPHPLLLVLDDIHWADLTSLRLLEFLSYELMQVPIVVVGTYRDVDLRQTAGAADIVGGLLRRARLLALNGFSRDEVASFVAVASTRPLPDAWTARLHELTDGNPFFLDEMLHLLEAHGGELPSSGWSLPHGILGTIKQRLEALSPDVVQLIAAGAVAGREFDLVVLEAALAVPRSALLERLRPAIERDIVRVIADRPGRLRFSHALVQDALRAELPTARRIELHRRCGEILETRYTDAIDADVAEVAHHYYEAAFDGCEAKALQYAERAGDQAMRALAFDEAATQFSRALQLLELAPATDARHRCEMLLRLGEATNRAAQGPESIDAYQRAAALARQLDSTTQLARAAIGLCGVGSTWAQYGRSDAALIAVLREALAGLPPDELGLRAKVMARLATELHFATPPVDTDTLSAEAVALARRAGDASTLAYTLPARLRCSHPDQREERQAIIEEILELTEGRGELAVHAYVWQLSEALQIGAMAQVEIGRELLARAVTELRQPRDLWLIPVLQSQRFVLEGRLNEAEQAAEEIMAHESLSPNGRMSALVLLFLVRREQGRHGELSDGLRSFAYQSATITAWRTTLAHLYAETGAEDAARAEIDILTDEGLSCLRRDNTWMLAVAGLAAAIALVGQAEQAAMVYRALQPYDGRNVVAASFYYFGPVAYYLGILAIRQGRRDDALRHLDAALAAARAVGAQPFVARTLLARAQAFAMDAKADPTVAVAWRRDAAAIANDLGLKAIAIAANATAVAGEEVATAPGSQQTASLGRTGDAWMLTYRGRASVLKARRGVDYLARLLQTPGQEFHVLDLSVPEASPRVDAGTAEAILDPRAKRELRARLADLRAELDEAETNNDLARSGHLRAEIEAIGEHLAQALGLGGRDRHVTATVERARAAVTKAIRAAIQQVDSCEPELAALLARTVRTGAFCCYTPLPGMPIVWTIET